MQLMKALPDWALLRDSIVSLIAQMHLMKAFPDWALNTGEMSAAKGEGQVTSGWHSCTAM